MPRGPNILLQMLQQSYHNALLSYRQKNPVYEQSKITAQVMAAQTDPSVKNKNLLISKICEQTSQLVTNENSQFPRKHLGVS